MVYMKIIDTGGERIVAICDEDLLGKKFTERGLVLHINKNFYGEELVPIDYAMDIASTATVLNLVGKNTINEAIKRGYIHPEAIIEISGIPHAQAIKMIEKY